MNGPTPAPGAQVRVVEATTRDQRLASLAVRWEVFVVEQGCPLVLEIDARDMRDDVVHLNAVDPSGLTVGTCRIIPDAPGRYHLGRIAVLAGHRGRRVGAALVEAMHAAIAARTPVGGSALVLLDAQVRARGFYEALGYAITSGEVFMDAGIEHVEMARSIEGTLSR
ncbi:GNAT family N-acetyltransferase [Actinomyces sp. B33]|uniref:GNAT family N-acetyltransferase n=1 Tax=Actinomyces sp. B33 TaxID=2942131 RepID=UPI002340CE3E|nr:GNAT family N-acetyltransferase [Actinomyces sp. B33]MDC4233092.1 GNAT family N-acetyltransferase [Actinomyces sp. B33]